MFGSCSVARVVELMHRQFGKQLRTFDEPMRSVFLSVSCVHLLPTSAAWFGSSAEQQARLFDWFVNTIQLLADSRKLQLALIFVSNKHIKRFTATPEEQAAQLKALRTFACMVMVEKFYA